MTTTIVSSGATNSGIEINSGDTIEVQFGGVAVDTVINVSGFAFVSSGGVASGTVLNSGGGQRVLNGGTAFGTVLSSGGVENVLAGGVASAGRVSAGGAEQVFGSVVSNLVVGFQFVSSGGSAAASTVFGGGNELVFKGGTVTGTTLVGGGTQVVFSGGVANASVVSSGGSLVLSGGTANNPKVLSSGFLTVSAGGVAAGNKVEAGGVVQVLSLGTAVGGLVAGLQAVSSGGSATGTTVFGGGAELVFADARATGTTVIDGGTEIVLSGGVASVTMVSSGGNLVLSGGFASNTVIEHGGSASVSSGGRLVSNIVHVSGSEIVFGGGLAVSGTVFSGGVERVSAGGIASGTIVFGLQGVESGGTADDTGVGAGGVQIVASGGAANRTIVGSGGTQAVFSGGTFEFTELNSGGTIDLGFLPFDPLGSIDLDEATDIATIVENGVTLAAQLAVGDYTGEFFHLADDITGGTLITVDGTPCYCRGTRILTPRGEVEVEALHIGDNVLNGKGDPRRIRWIGRRAYAGRFAAANREVLPVLIRAGALEDGVPRRDLMVSPLHAMYLDDVLIPASALVNGTSITQLDQVDQVEYFHIELDSHDIIFAEGALSETFVDDDSRGMFHNAAEFAILCPGELRARPAYCAPRVEDGELLEAVRHRLAARARAMDPAAEIAPAPGKLLGNVDTTRRDRVSGWAFDAASPDAPVRLSIRDNDIVIGEVTADLFRPDLKSAGIGDGHHGFELAIPGGLSPLVRHAIHVRRAADGQDLPNTPWVLKAEPPAAPVVIIPVPSDFRYDGCVDQVTRERISGWARDPRETGEPVALQILDNGLLVARVLANLHRPDLEQAGFGGRHGFDIFVPGGLAPLTRHVIQVRSERDGIELANSPVVIEPADSFDATLEQTVANAVASVATAGEQERVLSFILAQAERLRRQRADADGQRPERLIHRQLRRRMGPEFAGTSGPARRALVLDTRYPCATRDAGSQAILSHMRALRRLGYAVTFAAAEDAVAAPETIAVLEAQGIMCHRPPFYSSVEDVLRRQAVCFDVVYLHRADIASRYLSLARAYFPRARIVYSVADLHHVRVERQASVEERPELLAASRRLRMIECTAAWSADAVITHSGAEADMLRQLVPEANVHRVVWDVPSRPTIVPLSARNGIAFVGGYAHTPNQDAVRWLVETIMPLVWQTNPGIECLLIGSDMPASVRNLARPGVEVIGGVADLGQPVFDRVRLTVAPLRFGAGVKGKVLDSLAAGVPCVMSPIGAEGMTLPPALLPLIGADTAGLADRICRLHEGGAIHDAAVTAGLTMIRQGFSPDAVTAALAMAVEGGARVAGIPGAAAG